MIEIRNLFGTLGEFRLENINLTVKDGEYFVLLGPTGAGKTVLIEYIVGMYRQERGGILLDGEDITPLFPEERNIAYVPQDYALFPNLNVERNIAYGLEARRLPAAEIAAIVDRIVDQLRIGGIRKRLPQFLSGGEKQRVALGRALAIRPTVVLLDEPLSALDENLRTNTARELRRLQRETGATFMHVCHNFEEAADVADRIAFMESGRVVQTGTIAEIAANPRDEFTARFMKTRNLYEGVADGMHVVVGGLKLKLPGRGVGPGGKLVVGIRPENVKLWPAGASAAGGGETENRCTGVVRQVTWRPHGTEVTVDIGVPLVAFCGRDVFCTCGDTVAVCLPAESLIVISRG